MLNTLTQIFFRRGRDLGVRTCSNTYKGKTEILTGHLSSILRLRVVIWEQAIRTGNVHL